MPEIDKRAVVLTRGDRDALSAVVTQMRRESRHVFADSVLAVVDAYDAAEPGTDEPYGQGDILRTALEWAALKGVQIRDPDGWQADATLGSKPLEEPIDLIEFEERLQESTVGPS